MTGELGGVVWQSLIQPSPEGSSTVASEVSR